MKEVILICSTPEGTQEIHIEGDKLSFGRGSEVDVRLDDQGLSRLNSTIYREGDDVWMVDENSTNGTFINGEAAYPNGTPLQNGDSIKIGNYTNIKVRIGEKQTAPSQSVAAVSQPSSSGVSVSTASATNSSSSASLTSLLPIIITAFAIFVISISAVFIVITASGITDKPIVKNSPTPDETDDLGEEEENKKPKNSPTPKPTPSSETSGSSTTIVDNTSIITSPKINPQPPPVILPSKKYTEMSEPEKKQYVQVKAEKAASLIGNRGDNSITPIAVDRIKSFLDAYVTRIKVKPMTGKCRFGDNLQVTYERASKNAPFIIKSFNDRGLDPQIGLYLAMIESEHCSCLQSPSKPLGMFQFAYAAATEHFPKPQNLSRDANEQNGDDRCKPPLAAEGASSYMKHLITRFGTGPASVPLAIGSYNSGPTGLNNNLEKALSSNESLPRDFWTLISNSESLSKQFKSENFKYVPKFFAAAIIGQNPQDFGLNLQPLSTYTQ